MNDWVPEGVLVPYQHCLCSSSQLVDVRSTSDSILTCVQAGRVELSPPDKKPLSPEYVIGDCVWGHHILLGKPYHHHQPPVLLMTSPSTFTTVCFHRILFFSITEKNPKNTPKTLHIPISNLFCINNVFSYSPFSIAIVKYSTMINWFLNLEIWRKKCAAEEKAAVVAHWSCFFFKSWNFFSRVEIFFQELKFVWIWWKIIRIGRRRII